MFSRIFITLVLLGASLSINAAPTDRIVFTLDAAFADGGTATGTLTLVDWDGYNAKFDSVEITTTERIGHPDFPGTTYTCLENCAPDRSFATSSDNYNKLYDSVDNIVFTFKFSGELPLGGTFDLANSGFWWGEENFNTRDSRTLTSGSITESVVSLEDQLEALSSLILGINAHSGISNAMDSKLNRVFAALDDTNEKNDGAALNSMYAFCSSIDAQRGKKLTEEQASTLIEAGNGIISTLDDSAPLCE
jgi:hypothetical protein